MGETVRKTSRGRGDNLDGKSVLADCTKENSKLNRNYVFFWVIPRRLNFICRRFGTLCLFHLHRQVGELPRRKHATCRTRRKFEIM